MNNPLLVQIERLYNLIEKRENEYVRLINSGIDYNTLYTVQTNIEELKKRLHGLEEVFLNNTLQKNN